MNFLERFENTEIQKVTAFEKLPAGEYSVTVSNVELKEDTFPEALKISVEFTVAEGEHAGRKTWWNGKLSDDTSDKAMAFIKGQICRIAGVESTNGDIPGTLNSAVGRTVDISLQYKPGTKDPSKEYPSVFVN